MIGPSLYVSIESKKDHCAVLAVHNNNFAAICVDAESGIFELQTRAAIFDLFELKCLFANLTCAIYGSLEAATILRAIDLLPLGFFDVELFTPSARTSQAITKRIHDQHEEETKSHPFLVWEAFLLSGNKRWVSNKSKSAITTNWLSRALKRGDISEPHRSPQFPPVAS